MVTPYLRFYPQVKYIWETTLHFLLKNGEKNQTCLPMKHLGVLKNLIKIDTEFLLKLEFGGVFSVLDPDFEIRGGALIQTLRYKGVG